MLDHSTTTATTTYMIDTVLGGAAVCRWGRDVWKERGYKLRRRDIVESHRSVCAEEQITGGICHFGTRTGSLNKGTCLILGTIGTANAFRIDS